MKPAQAPGIVATSTRIRLFDPAGFVGDVLPVTHPGEVVVQVIHERCAALDIAKSVVVACVRRPHSGGGREQRVRTFEAFLDALGALA